MMDHFDYLRSRRSIRKFSKKRVSRETVEQILDTATYAPSAHNRQPWRFVALMERDSKQNLADAMAVEYQKALDEEGLETDEINRRVQRRKARVNDAPVGVLLCMDSTVMDPHNDPYRLDGEIHMAIQSVALAGGYILLAAHAYGLGAVWTCAPLFAPEAVKQALHLPGEWAPQALILIGYPDEHPKKRELLPLSNITRFL